MNKELSEYRKHLVLSEQKAQEDFDKTVISLSGGGLGISFAFVDKFVKSWPPARPSLMFLAWFAWTVSVSVVLLSHFMSTRAFRKAIRQIDDGQIHDQPGGLAARLVDWCNIAGVVLFALGVFFMAMFVRRNLGI